MNRDEKLDQLRRDVSLFDVYSLFPEEYSEDICYVEFKKQLILKDIFKMTTELEDFLFRFLEMFEVEGYTEYDEDDVDERRDKIATITRKIYNVDPFFKLEIKIPKEFDVIMEKIKNEFESSYVNIIKTLTEMAWKEEVLGGNIIMLQKNLAKACGKMYFDLSREDSLAMEAGIDPHTKDKNRGGAVIFGKPEVTQRINVSQYRERGSRPLWAAATLYCVVCKIAESKGDYIQAFRGFRKSVRVRKRFGLTRELADFFIKKDKEMLKFSLDQMGSRIDNIELRKYEVQKRAEQQQRNLKYKTVMTGE